MCCACRMSLIFKYLFLCVCDQRLAYRLPHPSIHPIPDSACLFPLLLCRHIWITVFARAELANVFFSSIFSFVFQDGQERLTSDGTSGAAPGLTLHELMTVGDPASLLAVAAATAGGDPGRALSDLARIAQQLDQAVGKGNRNKGGSGSDGERSSQRRPSIIQKGGGPSSGSSQPPDLLSPPPAHSQKPVTLPGIANPAAGGAELSQWYAQMLAGGKATNGSQQPQLPAAAVLELSLRPPTPAAATPSIFVPSRRIYVDPTLDVRKPTRTASSASTSIPSAHNQPPSRPTGQLLPQHQQIKPPAVGSSPVIQSIPSSPVRPVAVAPAPAQPPPQHPPPGLTRSPAMVPHQSSHRSNQQQQPPPVIPLVDLTSRSIKTEEQHGRGLYAGQMNGKLHNQTLMDLSVNHLPPAAHGSSFRPAVPDQKPPVGLPIHKSSSWAGSSAGGSSGGGHQRNPADVSISLNVKIEGSDKGAQAAGHSTAQHHHQQQQQQHHHRHSVSVVPVVKDEIHSGRHRKDSKEMMRTSSSSMAVSSQLPQLHHQQQSAQQVRHRSRQRSKFFPHSNERFFFFS